MLFIERFFHGNLLKINAIIFLLQKNANTSDSVSDFNPLIHKIYTTLACVACLCLLRCQARSLSLELKLLKFLVQKYKKTIYKVLNNGVIKELKLLKVHLTLCQTVLNAGRKTLNHTLQTSYG